MATIYIGSPLLWNCSLEEIFDWTYRSGLDGIELWAQQFFYHGFRRNDYLRLAALYPLKSCVHSQSWDLNLASINDGIRRQSVTEVKKSIELADSLGVDEVTVHPGHHTISAISEHSRDFLRESLEEILEYGQKLQIDISLEIMEKIPKEFVTSMEAMKQVCGDMFSNFVYTLDIAHCDSEEEALAVLKDYSPRISKIHISNRIGNTFHTPLSRGDYDMKALLPKLARYRVPLVMEGFDSGRELSTASENTKFIQTVL